MTHINGSLEEAYGDLCQVLRNPQDFGLGPSIQPPLENILERTVSVLAEIMKTKGQTLNLSNGNLEAELSQDADRPCVRVSK